MNKQVAVMSCFLLADFAAEGLGLVRAAAAAAHNSAPAEVPEPLGTATMSSSKANCSLPPLTASFRTEANEYAE